jgi:hypothetical protein
VRYAWTPWSRCVTNKHVGQVANLRADCQSAQTARVNNPLQDGILPHNALQWCSSICMLRSRPFKQAFARCVAGVLAAALLFELGLRPFVASWNQPAGPVRTIRSYAEGFSVAHFSPDGLGTYGNRLTGNPPLPGAPEGLIVGDSHVVGQAVRDEETMGAVVERLSRTAGHPLNVRQYGWTSANAPTYLGSAEELLAARNPTWVAVVINAYFSVHALTARRNWRMVMNPDGSYQLIDVRPPFATSRPQGIRRQIGRSTLALALFHRVETIWNTGASIETIALSERAEQEDKQLTAATARVPRAALLGLKKAFGSRLILVYTPGFFGADYTTVEPLELEILKLCAEQGIACVSTRAAMARERYDHFLLSRGFHNTAPGAGHFNATGHRIVGEEIWGHLTTANSPPSR